MARQISLFPADTRRRPAHVLCAVALLTALAEAPTAAAQVAGALDATFSGDGTTTIQLASGTGGRDEAFALAIDGSGGLLVAGYVRQPPEKFAVVRLLDGGTLDGGFGAGGVATVQFGTQNNDDAQARAMAVDAAGRIVLAGRFQLTNNLDFAVARLLADGSPDPSFSGDGQVVTAFEATRDDEARAVALTSDGRIVVAGYAQIGSSNRDIAVARYEADGDLDPTFSGDGKLTLDFGAAGGLDETAAVAVDDNDKILIAGYVEDNGTRDLLVFRLTTSGNLDPTFNGGSGSIRIAFGAGESSAAALVVQPNGRILVAGSFAVGNVSSFAVARLLANGTLDANFGNGGLTTTPIGSTAQAFGITRHPSGGRFTLGGAATVSGKRRFAAAQYRSNGTLDPTFGTLGIATAAVNGVADEGQAIVQQPDGKVVLAGWTSPSGSLRDFGLVRFTYSDCGDGALAAPEQCDGNDLGGVNCCSLACTFASAGTQCRATADVCDVAESCTGGSATCPADQFAGNGTPCRAVLGACDVAESCTGSAAACPADLRVAPGTPCRASLGICDLAESCDGGAACPNDARVAAGTPCRAAADLCDAVETCNGSASICPADVPAAIGTVCRISAGGCDAADTCDGATFSCPADLPATAGTPCRAGAGACDVAESCDGASFACPADEVATAGQPCRAVADACDVAESCDGLVATCPTDLHLPDGDSDGTCDVEDICPLVSDPSQTDTDADGLGDACDPCTSGVVIDKPVLRAESLLAPTGDDTFVLKGELVFSPARPALDPLVNGMRVQIQDGGGAVLFDAAVPPGAYDSNTRIGWRRNVNRTLHRFRSPTAFGNLVNKVKMVTRTRTPNLVDLKITGRNADFTSIASATGPLRAIVTLSPPGAALGHCGERAFPGPAPEPACGYLTPGPEDTFDPNSIFECR